MGNITIQRLTHSKCTNVLCKRTVQAAHDETNDSLRE